MPLKTTRGPRYTKQTLPVKTCAACKRPFAWRRKWARDWEGVRYCSDRCRKGSARTPD